MPKAGSLENELSEDRLAAGSQPGNFLCQCRRRGTLPPEPGKPGDKGGGARAGSQVTEVQSQLPRFPDVSDQVAPFTPLALPFPGDGQVSLRPCHPFGFSERSPSARSPSSFSGPRWAVLDIKCGERNADMARGRCCSNEPRSIVTHWLGTSTVPGIRETAGDTHVKETGSLPEVAAQQTRVGPEDVDNKRTGRPSSASKP